MGKKSSAAAEDQKVHGIDADKLDRASIMAALERVGIQVSKETAASLPACVETLQGYFREAERKDPGSIVQCYDGCGADSTKDFDKCPFCRVGESDGNPGDVEPEPEPGGEDGPGDPDEADGGRGFEPGDVEEGQDGTRVPVTDAAPPPEHVETPTGVKLVKLPRKKRDVAALVVPGDSLILGAPPAGTLPDAVLDQYVAEFKHIQRGMAAGSWVFAKKLVEGDIQGVWKRRKTSGGKVAYKNFETFSKVELGLSSRYVNMLQKMQTQFTEAQFKEIGPSKLRLVLEAAPGDKAKALEKLKAGASRREVERSIGRKGPNVESHKDKPKVSTSGKVTVALAEGKSKLPFVVKVSKDEERPAKQMTDRPYARYKLANDAVLWVTLSKNADGEIVGLFDVRRVDPDK